MLCNLSLSICVGQCVLSNIPRGEGGWGVGDGDGEGVGWGWGVGVD